MENSNLESIVQNENYQTLEKTLTEKIQELHAEREYISQKIIENAKKPKKTCEEMPKSLKKEILEMIISEIASNREENHELTESINQLTELISQADHELDDLNKTLTELPKNDPLRLTLLQKIENLQNIKNDNLEIQEKMSNAAKVNHEQYIMLKTQVNYVIDEYYALIFKLKQDNLMYKQENLNLKISGITLMKENILQSKLLNERQITIDNLTNQIEKLKYETQNMDLNLKSNKNTLYYNKRDSNACLDEMCIHAKAPKSIIKPIPTQSDSNKTQYSNNFSQITNTFNNNQMLNCQDIITPLQDMNSIPGIILKKGNSTKNPNVHRYNDENICKSNFLNTEKRNDGSVLSLPKRSKIDQIPLRDISNIINLPNQEELNFQNFPNSNKEKIHGITSKGTRKRTHLKIQTLSDELKNHNILQSNAMNIKNHNSKFDENQADNNNISIPPLLESSIGKNITKSSPRSLLEAPCILHSNTTKPQFFTQKSLNDDDDAHSSIKQIKTISNICLNQKGTFEHIDDSYSPINNYLKSKNSSDTPIQQLLYDDDDDDNDAQNTSSTKIGSMKYLVTLDSKQSSETKNPLETEPDDDDGDDNMKESQASTPVISQKCRSFYGVNSIHYRQMNNLYSDFD